jgi:hypothetical protein
MMPPAHTSLWLCPGKDLCDEEARRGVGLGGPGRRAAFSGSHIGSTTDANEAQAQTITTSVQEKVVHGCRWLDGSGEGWAELSGRFLCGSCLRAESSRARLFCHRNSTHKSHRLRAGLRRPRRGATEA